ncbi:efflux RND transporter periplasmic adaptor subunit [uncultured Rhodoferax sp.]|uniref:efflux RND transporter periplasmic adaptor subunit n=1 Tax=uncultured Rhodoferax sp. TaxID=223188 RepID=UPI0025E5101B|nr:efflux RND transporter periplasmic adaptor subunit [uncultured Rhodoferax sp.]
MNPLSRSPLLPACVLMAVLLTACNAKPSDPSATPASGAAPTPAAAASSPQAPATVTTVKALAKDLAVTLRATGTVSPLSTVEVRPQVSSTIAKVHFKEGEFVKAGQLLFTLDARTDEANVAKARAQLAKDQASLADVKRQFERSKQLFAQNFISQGAVDTAQAQVEAATATVAADQAAIDATRVALSYAQIKAPSAGRAGAVNVFAGSAVQANVTPLVTITQLDPIAVLFSTPQRNLADALQALNAKGTNNGAPVTATLADKGGSFQGHLQFVDNAVDASSGAVKAKAVFANKDYKLWPGAFVEVSQTLSTIKDAIVIPQSAIIQSARGTIVYVVEDGKAVLRPIKQVYGEAGEAAVTGLKAGEVVVMDGKQNLRPNSPVVERSKDDKAASEGKDGKGKPAASATAETKAP